MMIVILVANEGGHLSMRPWPARILTVVAAFVLMVVARHDAGFTHASRRADAIPGNTTIQSFNKAKELLQQVYQGHEEEYYCGCRFSGNTVDLKSCDYEPKKNMKKAECLEWDHVVPAEAFGQSFVEWREGDPSCVDRKGKSFKGRNCARKMSLTFRFMEANLYNLQPAIGEANWLRSDYSMAMIPGEAHEFEHCELKIQDRKVEPRREVPGDIARTYFYRHATYPGRGIISDKNRKLFEAWNPEAPVDDWERERARRIEQMQGNPNPFVP
jgi:deoxyribonuclease-1